jgi:fucose 4-O-acetylase-like acetyltransferase
MTTSKPNYLKFIAYLQVIGIVLVVLGHSLHEYPIDNGKSMVLYRAIYSFHMPLFFFISGFLMLYTSQRKQFAVTFGQFTLSKAKRLLLPFAVILTAVFLPRCLMSGLADDSVSPDFASYLGSLIYYDKLTIPYYWFIQCVFTLLIINYAILRRARNKGEKPLKTTLFAIFAVCLVLNTAFIMYGDNFFSIGCTLHYAVYFAVGMLYAQYYEQIEQKVGQKLADLRVFALFAALWLTLFLTMNRHSNAYILCSMAAIIACVSMAKIIAAHQWRFLDHLCGAYYMIFLLSWFCNTACQQVLHHFTDLPWQVYTVLSVVSGIYLPLAVYRLIERYRQNKAVAVIASILGH